MLRTGRWPACSGRTGSKDGIVTLAGAPGSVVLGRNIAAQARHVEGVVAVRDRFTYAPAAPAS
jgi:hypothetical protein